MSVKISVTVLVTIVTAMFFYAGSHVQASVDEAPHGEKLSEDAEILTEEDVADTAPSSEAERNFGCEDEGERVESVLAPDQVKLVGRLAKGMRRIVEKRDHGNWYSCGERLDTAEQYEISTAIAYHLILNQAAVGLESVSPWGIAGTAYNESGFDACALGLNPRKWAYSKGLLKKKSETRSHTKEEVLAFIKSPKAKRRYSKSGFDLGYCQVLSRFYRGQEEEMLTTDQGMRMCVIEMQARSQRNKTTMPWLYWKGLSKTQWYRVKIRRWAKMMGASRKELRKI